MDIVTAGRSPFRIVDLFSEENSAGPEDSLLEGLVDYLDDRERQEDQRLNRELVELYETCHTLVFGDCPRELQTSGLESLAYFIADALPMDLLWKQQILELRCEADRRERLSGYLREWAPHLQNAKVVRHRATGAGHGLN
jgi:Lon protease-like protein